MAELTDFEKIKELEHRVDLLEYARHKQNLENQHLREQLDQQLSIKEIIDVSGDVGRMCCIRNMYHTTEGVVVHVTT